MSRPARTLGFTLIELLVAMSILSLMGVLLLNFAASAIRGWRIAEARRQVQVRGQASLEALDSDLSTVFSLEPSGTDEIMAMFRCERLPDGSPMLHFIRTIEAGPERYYLAFAGEGGPRGEFFNQRDDDGDGIIDNHLRTLGGLMEVVYWREGDRLYRAVMAPPDKQLDRQRRSFAQAVVDHMVYFDIRFWDPWTTAWEPPFSGPVPKGARWALREWDSSRAGASPELVDRGYYVQGSENYTGDDVFPELARVEISIEGDEDMRIQTRLVTVAGESDGELMVDTTSGLPDPGDYSPYVLVDQEWMRVIRKETNRIAVLRGQRQTPHAAHEARAAVRAPYTFVRLIYMPSFRRDYLQAPPRKR